VFIGVIVAKIMLTAWAAPSGNREGGPHEQLLMTVTANSPADVTQRTFSVRSAGREGRRKRAVPATVVAHGHSGQDRKSWALRGAPAEFVQSMPIYDCDRCIAAGFVPAYAVGHVAPSAVALRVWSRTASGMRGRNAGSCGAAVRAPRLVDQYGIEQPRRHECGGSQAPCERGGSITRPSWPSRQPCSYATRSVAVPPRKWPMA